MYKTITIFVVITAISGCSSTLPSHDGSLHSVYGIERTSSEQAVALRKLEPQKQVTPVETYEPMVQTISGTGVIASNPITAIEVEPHFSQEPELSEINPIETIDTEPNISPTEDYEHTLAAGETLFSVSGDLTGSSHNWKAIADYNSIVDPSAITVGQSIVIPSELLITRSSSRKEFSSARKIIEKINSERQPEAIAPHPYIVVSANGTQEIEFAAFETAQGSNPTPPLQPIVSTTDTTSRSNPQSRGTVALEDKGSLKQSIANFASIIKTSFKLPSTTAPAISSDRSNTAISTASAAIQPEPASPVPKTIQTAMLNQEQQPLLDQSITVQTNPIDQVSDETEQPSTLVKNAIESPGLNKKIEQWVQVDGNFTPKAVYKGAGYTTGLLMRVSPGTKFKMTSKTNDWYEVETNQGAGYIFHRDVLPPQ